MKLQLGYLKGGPLRRVRMDLIHTICFLSIPFGMGKIKDIRPTCLHLDICMSRFRTIIWSLASSIQDVLLTLPALCIC